MISAISKSGKPYTHTSDKYFKAEDIAQFIKGLKSMNRNKRIAIFWDNATIHTSAVVEEYMEKHDIASIMCPPYSPEYNGIEQFWAHVKD